jgi:hypothetical protein
VRALTVAAVDAQMGSTARDMGITVDELYRRRPTLRRLRNHYALGHPGEYGRCAKEHEIESHDADSDAPGAVGDTR